MRGDRVRGPLLISWAPGLMLGVLVLVGGCAYFGSSDVKRGDQFLAAGNWEEASLAYKQALKDDPFNPSLQGKYAMARERAAAVFEERGRAYLKDRQLDLAAQQFKQALAIEPSNPEHQAGLAESLRLKDARDHYKDAERLAQIGRAEEAMEQYAKAAELDPSFTEPLESIAKLTEAQQALGRDDRRQQPVTLRFRNAGLKEVLEGVGKAGGVNLVFDKDVRSDPVTITIQDTPFEEAFNLILNSNNLFSRVLSPGLVIISPNTKQKQEQYQDLMIRTFYLSHAKAKDMLVLLKGMLDSKRMQANEQLNTIVIRDQPEKIEMAEKIILANDRQDSEVLFEVEVLEVNRTVNQTYGLSYPKQIAAALVPPGFTGIINGDIGQQFTYQQLTSLGQSSYLFKLPTNVQLDFFKQITDSKTLASPKIRVVNNKKAEINIGDKQPILLSTTNVLPGQAATGAVPTTSTVTSIEFRDTGVKLTVEPTIRLVNDLALKMKIEVITLGDQVLLQANPPITQFKFGNRTAETMLNIKDGETIVLGGLIQEQDQRTKVTIPWIGDLPVIGDWISSFKTQRVTTEVILTITPHILHTMTQPGLGTQVFWSGTESTYATAPLFSTKAQGAGGNSIRKTSFGPSSNPPKNMTAGMKAARQNSVDSGSTARLILKLRESSVAVGKEVRVDLFTERVQGLKDGAFTISYDPQVLELRSMVEGELPTRGDAAGVLSAVPNPSPGKLELKLQRPNKPVAEDGRVIAMQFIAKAPGVATLHAEMTEGSDQVVAATPRPATGVVRVR
jgi:general secretion pathway protein D